MIVYQINKGMTMNERILKLIVKYAFLESQMDKRFICELLQEFIVAYNLHDYVKKVIFTKAISDDNEVVAKYDKNRRMVLINTVNLESMIDADGIQEELPKSDIPLYKSFATAEMVFHELNHAHQYRLIDSNISGNVVTLLREGEPFTDDMIRKIGDEVDEKKLSKSQIDALMRKENKRVKKLYDENYDLDVSERLASNIAMNQVIRVIKLIEKEHPELLSLYQYFLLTSLIDRYDKNVSPTLSYFDNMARFDKLSSLDFYDSDRDIMIEKSLQRYGLNSRLYLGLPIKDEEYQRVQKRINHLFDQLH